MGELGKTLKHPASFPPFLTHLIPLYEVRKGDGGLLQVLGASCQEQHRNTRPGQICLHGKHHKPLCRFLLHGDMECGNSRTKLEVSRFYRVLKPYGRPLSVQLLSQPGSHHSQGIDRLLRLLDIRTVRRGESKGVKDDGMPPLKWQ
jgi:hypothetical protein